MSKYNVTVKWTRDPSEKFTDNKYSRGHQWIFDGGIIVPASSSPHIVPLPYSIEGNVDPEESFVASLSSCHMLFFLSIAAKNKFIIEKYIDAASGILEKNNEGNLAMTKVILRPDITFSGTNRPDREKLKLMHDESHEKCFIANSVKTRISILF
ncbi:MAG: OsmC family protein [Calditrichaceae bacterium]|jgi:organic hydroperoxide reductase OsmC/OhrA